MRSIPTFALVVAISLASVPATVAADPNPGMMRSGTVHMNGTGGNKTQVIFTVPAGKTFVLTDLYFRPCSSCLAQEVYLKDSTLRWQTQDFAQGQILDEHFRTGIVFAAGTDVIVETQQATNGWNDINWSGYLVSSLGPDKDPGVEDAAS